MLHILDLYESASSQFLNKENTSIFFSSNTPTDIRTNIIHTSGVKAIISSFEKYLRLPVIAGTQKA